MNEELKRDGDPVMIGWLAVILAAAWAVWLSLSEYYVTDAVGYQFWIPPEVNEFTTRRIGSFADAWTSQVNHWHTVNGRFVCHFFVQLFCGWFPQWVWAVANGLVWGYLVWLCGRIGGRPNDDRGRKNWIGLALMMALLPRLAFSSPMQMNYVWGMAVELTFIVLFFRRSEKNNILRWIGWILLSFFAGEWNEAFVIPVSIGLITLFVWRRGRMSAWEWTGISVYGAGALLLCLAPGNIVRLEDTSGSGFNVVDFIRNFLFAFYPLIIGIAAGWVLFGLKKVGTFIKDPVNRGMVIFLGAVIIGSYLMGALLRFSSGNRVVVAVGLAVIVVIEHLASRNEPKLGGMTILMAAGAGLGVTRTETAQDTNRKYEYFDRLYHESADGRIYVPIEELVKDWREDRFTSFYMTYNRKAEEPDAPVLKILPERAREVSDSDYNAIISLSPRAYLFVRSDRRPAKFLLKRRLGIPGTPLTFPISDRELDFDSPNNDICVDTLRTVRLGLYINERPYVEAVPYMIEE